MTNASTIQDEGLRITGKVGLGYPPQAGTYTSVAYNNAQPDVPTATWVLVRPDSKVTAFAGKVEYGQGIRTGFAIEVADELRVPVSDVEVVLGDTRLTPWDNGTFGSQSTARVGLQLRKAAATARETLLELAANRFDLPVSDLVCHDGRVVSRADANRGASYGELVQGESTAKELDDDVALHAQTDFTVMGEHSLRIDAIARVTGKAVYSQDIQIPGMLWAKVRRGPSYGATIESVDTSRVETMSGVHSVIVGPDTVAVLAETDEDADMAARMLRPRWTELAGLPTHADMPMLLQATAASPAVTQEAGSLEEGFAQAEQILEATYFIPFVSTVPMEPKAAVALWDGDNLTLWAGGQRPFGLRADLAKEFGIDESQVRVISTEIGGGFGSKSYYPVAVEVAQLAREAGRPVRVAYTRTDEFIWANFRPAALIKIKSGFMNDGRIVAWQSDAYHAGPSANIGRRGSDSPYDVPNMRSIVSTSDSPVRTGSYRSLGAAVNHFARESHMDEIAAAVGMDPIALRMKNLTHPRFRNVLEQAAQRFGWTDAATPSNRGIGCSLAFDVGSFAAGCFELRVEGTEVLIDRVVIAADCGLIVNPTGVENQVEGAVVQGIGTVLYEGHEFKAGRLLTSSFARYRVPRSTDIPRIETVLTGDQNEPSTGAGEVGIVPVGAAIANAVFDLTGRRIRELPIQQHL